MGNDEAVTPVFPNSDYCTGVCGSTGVMEALVRRAQDGGSYGVDVSYEPSLYDKLAKACAVVLELLFSMACTYRRHVP